MTDARRYLILGLYAVGVLCQAGGTIALAVVAARDAAGPLMTRAALEGREAMVPSERRGWWERVRQVVVPAAVLVVGLGFEVAATSVWLFSS